MENSPLISKLLEKEEYKKIYHQYLEELVVNYVKSGKYKASISKVNELIKEYIKNDSTAFFTYEQYENSLPVLLQFGKDRAESIIAQLNGQQSSTTYGNITTNIDLSALGTMGRGFGGNMPAMNQGERPNMFGNIEDRENMTKVMEIIGNSSGNELTEEERGKLRELGLDDTQVEEMINMRDSMSSDNRGKNLPNNNFQPDDNKNMMPQRGDMPQSSMIQQNKNVLIVAIICILSLLLTLIYVSKFKRRKYITCKPPY